MSLKIKGHIYQDSSIGTGSIVAIYNAVDRILKRIVNSSIIELIQLLKVQMQAEVHVELVIENQHVNGIGIDHDILQASCKSICEAHAKYIAQDLESR